MKPLLLTVDLQQDYLSEPGLEPAAGEIVAGASRLLEGFRSRGLPVVHVHTSIDTSTDNRMPHWKSAGLWRCVIGTDGHKTPARLAPKAHEPVIQKSFFSAFSTGELDALLSRQQCDTLVVCGVHLHGCVRQTVIDAYERGFTVWVADDAVGGYSSLQSAETRSYLDGRAATFETAAGILELLDGSDLPGAGARDLLHRSPRDPDKAWSVRVDSADAIEQTARRVHDASPAWRARDVSERAHILEALANELDARRDEVASLIVDEIGKPARMATAEVEATSRMIRAVVRRFGDGSWADLKDGFRRVPLGVIAAVTPWNNPLYLPAGKIVPALLFGNGVLWKPSPHAFQTGSLLEKVAIRCGVPDDLLGVVSGAGRTAQAAMSHPVVSAVSITGSSQAGAAAQYICGTRRIPLQAELGGNNAALVWHDADLDLASTEIARGAFEFAGQRCTATRRAVVHESVYDSLVERIEEAAARLPVGDPREEHTCVGPVITSDRAERIESLMARAEADGAPVLRVLSKTLSIHRKTSKCFVSPAVVLCDRPESEIVQEESFGPVLVVQRANDWKEAVDLCNGVRQGLVATLFTRDEELKRLFLDEMETGIVKYNQSTAGADVDVPFGGWKSSSVGPPEHGEFDLEFYTRPQTVYR